MGTLARPAIERFTEKYVKKLVVVNGKLLCCWLWTAQTDKQGYGRFWDGSKRTYAHIWSYKHFVGPIPAGKQLDHFRCWTPGCVNPAHLRPATAIENIGNARLHNAAKTHCKYGHPFTPENTAVRPQANHRTGKLYVARFCLQCRRERKHGRRAKRARGATP